MKVCENCGEEIGTRDGDNLCGRCDDEQGRHAKNARRNAARRARDEAARSLGLVKVRGALGGTYYE